MCGALSNERQSLPFAGLASALNPVNYMYNFSPYLTGNTLRLRYKAQPVNAV
jgi:hypothetical protein